MHEPLETGEREKITGFKGGGNGGKVSKKHKDEEGLRGWVKKQQEKLRCSGSA